MEMQNDASIFLLPSVESIKILNIILNIQHNKHFSCRNTACPPPHRFTILHCHVTKVAQRGQTKLALERVLHGQHIFSCTLRKGTLSGGCNSNFIRLNNILHTEPARFEGNNRFRIWRQPRQRSFYKYKKQTLFNALDNLMQHLNKVQ